MFPKTRIATPLLVAVMVVIGGAYALSAPTDARIEVPILDRLADSMPISTLSEVKEYYDASPIYTSRAEYVAGAFADAVTYGLQSDRDISGMIRVRRWMALVKTVTSQTTTFFLGLGPSFGTSAVDGYFLRTFIEGGLIGTVLFLIFLATLLADRPQSSWAFREYIWILVGTGLFIDIFASYKPMILLWLWHGMNQYRIANKQHAHWIPNASGRLLETGGRPSPDSKVY
jgi:hypothetical protein